MISILDAEPRGNSRRGKELKYFSFVSDWSYQNHHLGLLSSYLIDKGRSRLLGLFIAGLERGPILLIDRPDDLIQLVTIALERSQ